MDVRRCPSSLDKGAGCKSSVSQVARAQQPHERAATLIAGSCVREERVVLARDLLRGAW